MVDYHMDSHKLKYHIDTVQTWLSGGMVYPIYVEISPTGVCNHRCTFCGLDFMGYARRGLDVDVLERRLSEMAQLGVKSVMFAGEGEPFLHKHMARIIRHTARCGIDVAVATNGVTFRPEVAEQTLRHLSWIKFSINAGTPATYAQIHRCPPIDFERTVENIRAAAAIKREGALSCTVGIQLVLLPENRDEVGELARIGREAGADYLVIKPFSQHTQSKGERYRDLVYNDGGRLSSQLERYNTDRFRVIVRQTAMRRWDQGCRSYRNCLASPFWSYIDAGGEIWGCSVHLTDPRFGYGNIYESSFQQIWEGKRRRRSLHFVETQLDVSKCRVNCRMDAVNRYLWELKHPPVHVNFI